MVKIDIREQIGIYLNTSFKQTRDGTIYAGHNLVNFGYWSRTEGFVKKNSSSKGTVAVPCPVIAIVDEKIRESNLVLTIVGKIAEDNGTEDFEQLGTTITKKLYKTGIVERSTTLTIERFTRPTAIFLLSGLGNKIFDITVTSDVLANEDQIAGGKVTFYGLASEGSRILYYLGMFNLHNTFKKVINSIWISPTKCPTCNGTGSVAGDLCPQCKGYKFSGENASRRIALDKGHDVKISRRSFESYPLTESEWSVVWRFINKSWTQKWWVTPTILEIKRMFAHFYNVLPAAIRITERFHFSMPQWNISLPREGTFGSPFVLGDIDLMKFVAESVTPAGVNVFVGFYDIQYLGNFDDLDDSIFSFVGDSHPLTKKIWQSSFGQYRGLWRQRFRFWNGWCECTDNFEGDLSNWNESGVVDIHNANDIGRHWCRLKNDSAITTVTGLNICNPTGVLEVWIHPCDTDLRIGAYLSGIDLWAFYVDFQDGGFYDHDGNLIRYANSHNDYHLSIDFVTDVVSSGVLGYIPNVRINRNIVASNIPFLNSMGPNRPVRIESSGIGYSFVDNFGGNWIPDYETNDNWQRLYPWGWGKNHRDCLSGVDNLYEKYFRNDKVFIGSTGVCV